MLVRYLMLFFHLIIRYGNVFMYVMAAIVGIILSKKAGKADSVRIGGALLLLAAAFIAEYFLPVLFAQSMSETLYFITLFAAYIIRYGAMFLAFKILCGYRLSKWVGFVFILAVVIAFFYCMFRARTIFGMGSFVNGIDKKTSYLMAFFNSDKALDYVYIMLTFVPPVSLFIDGIITTKE